MLVLVWWIPSQGGCACVRVRVWECVLGMYSCLNKIVMHTIHVSPLPHDWALQTGESQKERDEKGEREREKFVEGRWKDYGAVHVNGLQCNLWKVTTMKSMERDLCEVHGKGLQCSPWKGTTLQYMENTEPLWYFQHSEWIRVGSPWK